MRISKLLKKAAATLALTATLGVSSFGMNGAASASARTEKAKAQSSLEQIAGGPIAYPYNTNHFRAAERIIFLSPHEASLNIMPADGKTLDLKITLEPDEPTIISPYISKTTILYGVRDSVEFPIPLHHVPLFSYRLESRLSSESAWTAYPTRYLKTPSVNSDDSIEILLVGDSHTPDDADLGQTILRDSDLIELRKTGNIVNYFDDKLNADPLYRPVGEENKLMNAFFFASMAKQIKEHEHPDFLVDLGDLRGSFGHKWPGLRLTPEALAAVAQIWQYQRDYFTGGGTRNIYSLLAPFMPIFWVKGNHDGIAPFFSTKDAAIYYTERDFKQPSAMLGGFGSSFPYTGYYAIAWGDAWVNTDRVLRPIPLSTNAGGQKSILDPGARKTYSSPAVTILQAPNAPATKGKVLFIVLDVMRYIPSLPRKPEEWTLGPDQMAWFEQVIKNDAKVKIVSFHHVLGGSPAGSNEGDRSYAYGRLPMFLAEDYRKVGINPALVEQVKITELARQNNVNYFIYGHDHVFATRKLGKNARGQEMYAIGVGSPKHIGELNWWEGPLWKQFYGEHNPAGRAPDFWTCPGYAKLVITKDQDYIEYIRSASPDFAAGTNTNIPNTLQAGDTVQRTVLNVRK